MERDHSRSVPEPFRYERVTSTNDVLLRRADQGLAEHTLVVADEQTRARTGGGRWHAPRGGLWLSTLWRPNLPVGRAALLTLAGAWGVREGIRRHTGIGAGIKWPNDVLVEGRRVAAVSVEGRIRGRTIDHAVIGIGINANNPGHALPDPVAEQATSLTEELGHGLDLPGLLRDVARALADTRALLEDPQALVAGIDRCWTQKGRDVSIDVGHELLEGQARAVGPDGALVVEQDGAVVRVDDPNLAKFVHVV